MTGDLSAVTDTPVRPTVATALINGWHRADIRVGAAKVTGCTGGGDRHATRDAGAAELLDHLDFGLVSTFGTPIDTLRAVTATVTIRFAKAGVGAVVLELADGLLRTESPWDRPR
ncbi:hypothetical protein [Streptomyces alanosinicus]|uniref:Uncharacterized protein n=1 Tax=Streptomyces alanosinicus TaxID=68171 RepID=A0A919D5J9_9ACTN|nr:hypothetical protein [Streptomyces alanosinicus]GHE09092.1 hypothetical protein GCM10010339_60300 [Streptomyces alanosinicus]